nr:MAG TPA: hypothetical protein [Caudoviricetes sp.]
MYCFVQKFHYALLTILSGDVRQCRRMSFRFQHLT